MGWNYLLAPLTYSEAFIILYTLYQSNHTVENWALQGIKCIICKKEHIIIFGCTCVFFIGMGRGWGLRNILVHNFAIWNYDYRFNGALSLELSNDHPNLRIIHRKVAIILGQWVSEVMWALFFFNLYCCFCLSCIIVLSLYALPCASVDAASLTLLLRVFLSVRCCMIKDLWRALLPML